ncbi:MAG: ABC transporter ATP-binding protein/permease [Negativicutes bacterium]|nr:ABC transporter ATP-binding protein/permease [Negativicutes bacterium]
MYYRGREYDSEAMRQMSLDRRLLRVLWAFAEPFRHLLALALVLMLLAAAADLWRPYLMKVAIDDYIAEFNPDGLRRVVYLYAASLVFSAAVSYAETFVLQYIGQQVIYNIRAKVFQKLIYRRFGEMESQPVGRMVTRVTNDTDAVKELYTDVLVAFASDIIILSGIVVVMLSINWRLALVAFTIIPPMFLLTILYQRFAREAYRRVREKTAVINTYLQESLNGIGVIKAFWRFERTAGEYRAINKEYMAAGLREMRTFAIFRPFVDLLHVVATVAVLSYGGWEYAAGALEVGVVVAFLRYVEKFFWPIKDISEKYSLLQSALAAAERIYELIAAGGGGEEDQPPATGHQSFRGHIRFENVWFAYKDEDWVLQDVSFTINAGEFVGIAGPSGSGKTTVISLLLRFYEPQKGAIFLDGQNIQTIPLSVLRHQIGVVFQDVHLFRGTIRDNITLFDQSIPAERIMAAATTANLDAFVRELPQKYETPVGYHGALLSSGQRQLISLARVLAWRSSILILDEATSSIDSATEALIQTALERIAKTRTMLVVAHRLSTIQHADRIIVLSKGRVAEQGTHKELISCQGVYQRLYSSQ